MKLRSVLFVIIAGLSVLVIPAAAVAADFCFNLKDTGTNTAVGKLRVQDSVTSGAFTSLLGTFTNDVAFCPGGGGEVAVGTGQFGITGATANVSFVTAGTTNCFPVTIDLDITITGFPALTGTGILDIQSLAASAPLSATNAGVACP